MFEAEKRISKIALIGAQSVGKTTILNHFQEKFRGDPRVAVLDEGARIFFDKHPEITGRSVVVQEQIQDFVLSREQSAYRTETKLIITDRSVLDPIILTAVWDTKENAQKLHSNVYDWLLTYSLFVLLDCKEVPNVEEEYRKETPEDRLLIQDSFINFCKENNLPLAVIIGTLQQRIAKIEELIDLQL